MGERCVNSDLQRARQRQEGAPDISEKLKVGHKAGGKNFKVHIDGYSFPSYFTGEDDKVPLLANYGVVQICPLFCLTESPNGP